MMIKNFLIGAVCLTATSVSAAPVQWTVNTSSSAWSAMGTFIHDAATDLYSDIMITVNYSLNIGGNLVTGSDVLTDLVFGNVTSNGRNEAQFGSSAADLTGHVQMAFATFAGGANLTDAGGVVPVYSYQFGYCLNSDCSGATGSVLIDQGPLVGAPVGAVPLPASGVLTAAAFGLLGWRARRKTRTPKALSIPS